MSSCTEAETPSAAGDHLPPRSTPPRLPAVRLPRRRVRDRLDRRAPLTVVSGPQGYGKTIAVADWLVHPDDDAVWLTATPELDDTEAFRRALQRAAGGRDVASREPADPVDQLARTVRRAGGPARTVLVVDDAHHLRDRTLLRTLVELVRRHRDVDLVVVGRGGHPIALPAAGVVDVETVPPEHLLFTVAEVADLARLRGVELDAGATRRLHAALGGWPAPTRVVLDAAADGAGELPLTAAEAYVREVVAPDVAGQPVFGDLLRFSLASRLTRRLVRDLSGDDAAATFERLHRSGLVHVRYDEDDVELVAPPTVRQALADAFQAQDPDGARAMHRRLSDWYAARDGDDERMRALEHALAARDLPRADRIWDGHEAALGMHDPGRLVTVLRSVPPEVLAERPSMVVASAASAAAVADSDGDGRMTTLRTYAGLSARYQRDELTRFRLPDLIFVGTWQSIRLRLDGRFDEATALTRWLTTLVERRVADGESPGNRLAWFHLQAGVTCTLLGDHDAAVRRYELAWQHRTGAADYVASNAAANLALTFAIRGEHTEATRWLGRHRAFATVEQWGHHLVGVGGRLAAAWLAFDRLDTAACRAELDVLGDGTEPVELWPYVAHLRARYEAQFGDPAEGLRRLDAARRRHEAALVDRGAAATLIPRAAADLFVALGDRRRAEATVDRADPKAPAIAAARARLALRTGNPAGALAAASAVDDREPVTPRDCLDLQLVESLAALRLDDPGRARELLHGVARIVGDGLLAPLATLTAEELGVVVDLGGVELTAGQADAVGAHRRPDPDRLRPVVLTPREQQLAAALATTASRQQIAADLYLSINTVKKQLVALYRKLGVTSRDEAVLRLRDRGLLH